MATPFPTDSFPLGQCGVGQDAGLRGALAASTPKPPAGSVQSPVRGLGKADPPRMELAVGVGRRGEGLGPEGTCAVPGPPRLPARCNK